MSNRSNQLDDADWEELLELINEKECTPFIGAGAAAGTLPLAGEIASQWADRYGYPLSDAADLARVAEFLAIERYEMFPKILVRRQFQSVAPPDFSALDEPHAVLADLRLPIYITTNYDGFMLQALKSREIPAKRAFCCWNRFPEVAGEHSVLDPDSGYTPTPEEPLVYHLHGYYEMPQSMVLTEGDYLDFVIRLSRDQDLLPPAIRTALTATSLLFVGYSLADWNFRVLFRGLMASLEANLGFPSIAVQLPPGDLAGQGLERAQSYLDQYSDRIQKSKVRIYWGDARQFAKELRCRWEAYKK